MTQTTIADIFPMTAMVTWSPSRPWTLRYFPIESVQSAREQYGPTLADARSFVEGTACNECGVAREDIFSTVWPMTCQGCGIRGCVCVLTEDGHADGVFWCGDCGPVCGGSCCA